VFHVEQQGLDRTGCDHGRIHPVPEGATGAANGGSAEELPVTFHVEPDRRRACAGSGPGIRGGQTAAIAGVAGVLTPDLTPSERP
jgi:hypothetical protein